MRRHAAILRLLSASSVFAQPATNFSDGVKPYIRPTAKRTILTHIRIIDATGKPATADQNLTIESGEITAIEPGADLTPATDTEILDMRGRTVMRGIAGIHEHMFYIARPNYNGAGKAKTRCSCHR